MIRVSSCAIVVGTVAAVAAAAIGLACGGASAPAKPSAPEPAVALVDAAPALADADPEQARHDEIAAAHRKLEAEQSEALAAACEQQPPPEPHPRCLPSCYPTEPVDARAGEKLAGAVEIQTVVCKRGDAAPLVIAAELDVAKRGLRKHRGRFPAAHKRGTWQAEVEAAIAATEPRLAHGDVIRVADKWKSRKLPLTGERVKCVTVSHFTRKLRPLDGCGTAGGIGCEATGSAVARGINVVHYRLAEARTLHAAGKPDDCQTAALEAVAVARGLPRWRQYMKLNVATWKDHAGFRTRFDGVLDEDAAFATAAQLGTEAEAVYAECGGAGGAPTTAAQEQSFHTCW